MYKKNNLTEHHMFLEYIPYGGKPNGGILNGGILDGRKPYGGIIDFEGNFPRDG